MNEAVVTMQDFGATGDRLEITPPAVSLHDVDVAFDSDGGRVVALQGVNLDIAPGEFVAVVGPSGCGKTTILNMLAGLMKPSAGVVSRHGEQVVGTADDIGYMLAVSALLPWRTAQRNVEVGLQLRKVPRRERKERALELLRRLEIGDFAKSFPSTLSHGMQQRVAIARTLAVDPDLWLMDEPFGALDAQTRLRVQAIFLDVWGDSGSTCIFVTHDLGEAVLLADRVVVMSSRPSRVVLDKRIDLERPRDLASLRFDPQFQALERECWEALRDEL